MKRARASWHNQFSKAPKEARTDAQGEVFDSKAEMKRWQDLKLLERAGEISGLRRQVRYDLILPNGNPVRTPTGRVARYTADYVYDQRGVEVIEEWKGFMTPEARLRISVFEAIYGKKVTIQQRGKAV